MSDDYSDDEDRKGVLIAAKDQLLAPLTHTTRLLTSKTAQKTYLHTILAALTSVVLLLTALTAYTLFYYAYVPAPGFRVPLYLQFDAARPWALADIRGRLKSYQHYDVSVHLHMPRTPANRAAGNFMVELQLLAAPEAGPTPLLTETRPAILRYRSLAMEVVQRAAVLPLHLVGVREEADRLALAMLEGAEFGKGRRNVPERVRVELRSAETLQVYEAAVEFTARLKGLRYFMTRYRLTAAVVLTALFWTVEAVCALAAWAALSYFLAAPARVKSEATPDAAVKEEDTLSDTPHTFPTLSGQPRLAYEGRVKHEDDEDEVPVEVVALVGEQADDEDEDADFVREELGVGRGVSDSGIGTSLESSGGAPVVRRRRSARYLGEG